MDIPQSAAHQPRNAPSRPASGIAKVKNALHDTSHYPVSDKRGFTIPQIAPRADIDLNVGTSVTVSSSKLSAKAKFRKSNQPTIAQIIALLSDTDVDTRKRGADNLEKLSEQADFRELIQPGVPQIIDLLCHSEYGVRMAGAKGLLILSEHTEFREAIQPAIPLISNFLTDSELPVLEMGVDVLSKLSEHAEFREAIQPAIPLVIRFLTDSEPAVREIGADVLLKLSGHAEFRESIEPAIPLIIRFLTDSDSIVLEVGADVLSQLSEHAEFRKSIQPAIPLIIRFLGDSDPSVLEVGADALLKLSKQAEFRESIQPGIPQIITLLGHSEHDVRMAGAKGLLILSEQAEFRKSLTPQIPQMIAFLSHSDPDVRGVSVTALSDLSQQAEFLKSIQSAIPLIVDLLGDVDDVVREAGAHALHKISEQAQYRQSILTAISQHNTLLRDINNGVIALPEPLKQGINAHTISNIVDGGESGCFQTTSCWIAAEHALQHARSNISLISEVFDRWHVQKSEYVVHAGFDESLIKSGVGYLEQIHVFVSAEVNATHPLLSELGKLLSPFSSILFTDSSSYHLPVFKDNGSVWEFDELVYCTASKFVDGGSSAKSPLTVISLSPNPDLAYGPIGFSQGSSDSGEGDKNSDRTSRKGKERDRGDEDDARKGDKDDEHPPDDPEQPSEGRTITGLEEISFEIVSRIYPAEDEQNAFQTLTMHGNLTINTTPLARNPRQFSKRYVQFMELTFDTESTADTEYKQFHVRVVVDSQQENARVNVIKPKRTRDSDGEEKQSSSTKTSRTRGITAGLTFGPHPQGAITGTATKTNEVAAGSERKRYNSRITEHHRDGIVHWGFNIDDENLQKRGIDMQKDVLPTVSFEFVGDSNVPAPPPKSMDIVISSYWSMILPSEPKSTWIRKLLHLFESPGNTQTTSYSNLLQIVVLNTVPSNLSESSHYRAKMTVRSGASDPPEVKRLAADSVNVTPAIVNDLWKLSTFDLPTITKFKLSDNCIQILENSSRDSKSH